MTAGCWLVAGVALLMVLTFLVSNGIAWWLEHGRRRRIAEKTERLAAASSIKTPVTIVTGFLGSGKTTLVNRILTSHEHGKRIVVIENEAGALSIDDQILRASEQEKSAAGIFVMKNGCMCCTGDGAGPELERVLNHLLELLDEHEFDYVLIETSGLADPAPIMQTFFSHKMCSGRFVLDGVVAMVDAKNIWSHVEAENASWWARTSEAYRQIALANTIVINKTDMVSALPEEQTLETLEALMRSVNPHAHLVRAQHSDVPLERIFNQHAFEPASIRGAFGFDHAGDASCLPQTSPRSLKGAEGTRTTDDTQADRNGHVRQRASTRSAGGPHRTRGNESSGGGGVGNGHGGRRRGSGETHKGQLMMSKVEHSPLVAAISMRWAGREKARARATF